MDNLAKIKEGIKLIHDGLEKFDGGPSDYYLACLVAAYDLVVNRFAPFKRGDRVTLLREPDYDKSPGWRGCNGFLQPGEPATVESIDIRDDGRLYFGIVFDDESWIDSQKIKHLVSQKHIFCFLEEELRKIS